MDLRIPDHRNDARTLDCFQFENYTKRLSYGISREIAGAYHLKEATCACCRETPGRRSVAYAMVSSGKKALWNDIHETRADFPMRIP